MMRKKNDFFLSLFLTLIPFHSILFLPFNSLSSSFDPLTFFSSNNERFLSILTISLAFSFFHSFLLSVTAVIEKEWETERERERALEKVQRPNEWKREGPLKQDLSEWNGRKRKKAKKRIKEEEKRERNGGWRRKWDWKKMVSLDHYRWMERKVIPDGDGKEW